MLNLGAPAVYAYAASMENSNSELVWYIREYADMMEVAIRKGNDKDSAAIDAARILFNLHAFLVKNHIRFEDIEAAFGKLGIPLAEE